MINISPKQQFQTIHVEHAKRFGELVADPSVRVAMTSAFAELQFGGVTTEEMNGAKKFIAIFAGLAENEPVRKMPIKALKTIPS